MSRTRTMLLGTSVLCAAAVAAFALKSQSVPDTVDAPSRNLTLGTELVGESSGVSDLERGLVAQASMRSDGARASRSALPPQDAPAPLPPVDLTPLAPPEIPPAQLTADHVEAEETVEAPAPAPVERPLPVRLASSGSMALAPGQSVAVYTASSAGRESSDGLPPGMAEAMRGQKGSGFSGSIGGGQCRPRRGGGALVLE